MQISLGNAYQAFIKYDKNGDEKLTKQELAQAALDLKDQGRMDEFTLFATFIQGGKDGKGLFPDADKDGALSFSELAELAGADGKAESISSDDFKTKFPNQAGSGNDIDIEKLKKVAYPDQTSQQVTLGSVFQIFAEYDSDGDNKLSKQEIAQAALAMKDAGRTNEFMLFATFLQGGKDGKGLFPDTNKDGYLNYSELANLAKGAGNANAITPEDFKAKFPQLAGGGNTIDVSKLEKIANPDSSQFSASQLWNFLMQFFGPYMGMFGYRPNY